MEIFEIVKDLENREFPRGVQSEVTMAVLHLRRALDLEAVPEVCLVCKQPREKCEEYQLTGVFNGRGK